MKWLRKILRYAPEVIGLGKDVRELVDKGYPKRVLNYVVEKLTEADNFASAERARIEQRINDTNEKLRDLERRLDARETHA